MSNIVTYELTPLDTLFFRGSTPMEAGQVVCNSMFPPPVSAIEGAFWTESCMQNNTGFALRDGVFPFNVNAFLIKKGANVYVPSPSTWFVDTKKKLEKAEDYNGCKIIIADDFSTLLQKVGGMSSEENIPFIKAKEEAQPLNSVWINIDVVFGKPQELKQGDVLLASDIYATESRTGIALDKYKHTKEGEIYNANHIRLKDGLTMMVALDGDVVLSDSGIFQLGGERRLCKYKKVDNINHLTNNKQSDTYVSLCPIVATIENVKSIVSSGKFTQVSGWDLEKGFHKPSKTIIPAGAVFNYKINAQVYAIEK